MVDKNRFRKVNTSRALCTDKVCLCQQNSDNSAGVTEKNPHPKDWQSISVLSTTDMSIANKQAPENSSKICLYEKKIRLHKNIVCNEKMENKER